MVVTLKNQPKRSLRSQRPLKTMLALILGAALLFFGSLAFGGTASTPSTSSEIIFSDLRLMAAELIDDMVYSWTKDHPTQPNASLVLADLSAPVGLDTRFNDLVENRLYELLQKHPQLTLKLIHCSACQQWMTVSTPQRTTISRGIDQPETLEGLKKLSPGALGLSLQFEARDRELFLLAQIFEISPPQKIVWAKRFSTTMGVRQTLREANPLISLEEARQAQNQILQGREPMKLITRLQIHNFKSKSDLGGIPPLIFAEQSLEGEILPYRNQRAGISVGVTSLKDSLSGWSFGGRYSHLMFRQTPSLVYPDFYWFVGVQYLRLQGLGAALFAEDQIDLAKLLKENEDPKASHTVYQFGFEALIKYRFGITVYWEYFPNLEGSRVISEQSFLLPYHGLGTGMVFQW